MDILGFKKIFYDAPTHVPSRLRIAYMIMYALFVLIGIPTVALFLVAPDVLSYIVHFIPLPVLQALVFIVLISGAIICLLLSAHWRPHGPQDNGG